MSMTMKNGNVLLGWSHSGANLIQLPEELLLRIGNEILRHPKMMFGHFKQLRLVCKAFDRLLAPIVLSSLVVFRGDSSSVKSEMLLSLIHGSSHISYAKKLVLNSWDSGDPVMPPYHYRDRVALEAFRSLCVLPVKWVCGVIANPKNTRGRLRELRVRLRAKKCIARMDQISFDLPSVQTVTWSIGHRPHHNSQKSMDINLRLLETLPSLHELNLYLYNSSCHRTDLLAASLPKLRNLQKLMVYVKYIHRPQEELPLVWLKDVIARCPDLTHLVIRCTSSSHSASLSQLFDDIPADRPLKLQHLWICSHCYNMTPRVLSHLRSLTSLNVFDQSFGPSSTSPIHEIWQILRDESIFVSKLRTNFVNKDLLSYLSHLDNLTHFAVHGFVSSTSAQETAQSLFQELATHSSTLTHLELSPPNWSTWHCNTLAKLSFLQCIKLQELTFVTGSHTPWHDIIQITGCVSQTEAPLIVAVKTQFSDIYEEFIYCCCASASPQVRRLGQRIVHTKPRHAHVWSFCSGPDRRTVLVELGSSAVP
ncbi:hypothetical protein APHAL10511_003270 [Amanita phalloides]|nr:hypothetical protein APHAL10511_003270 [Amanita phalloides]